MALALLGAGLPFVFAGFLIFVLLHRMVGPTILTAVFVASTSNAYSFATARRLDEADRRARDTSRPSLSRSTNALP